MYARKEDRSLTSLFTDLADETLTLLRQEVRLAKTEMSQKVDQAQSGIASLAVGGAIAFAGLLVLLDAAVYGLAEWMSWDNLWLSALIVGLVVGIIGLILLQRGRRNLKAGSLTPQRTVASLRRDTETAKESLR